MTQDDDDITNFVWGDFEKTVSQLKENLKTVFVLPAYCQVTRGMALFVLLSGYPSDGIVCIIVRLPE